MLFRSHRKRRIASTPPPAEQPWLAKLGPGLITGAADDDPSGIATYSQAGAGFGFGLLWTMALTYPLMAGIQIVSARIGRVSGRGLAGNMARRYPAPLVYGVVALLVLANTINIAADLAAMGDALELLIGGRERWYAAGFGLLSVLLQLFIPYQRYVKVLKWLTLALLAYVATIFTLQVPWGAVLHAAVLPKVAWNAGTITMIVALLGTTISPYLFFWQASEEVERLRADPGEEPIRLAPEQARAQFRRIRLDTLIGMGFSNLVAFFIMLTTALVFHSHGVTSIESSAQAAAALRPLAGELAFGLFAAGIIGTGLLALPVLAGSAAYAMAGAFRWRSSLAHPPAMAGKFYAIIVLATLGGVALCFAPLDPIKALYWSAVINGVISAPVMIITMLMASDPRVMGNFAIGPRLKALGWCATATMCGAVLFMFYSFLAGVH